jgi:phosphopantothenoylcysteine decarboxylase
MANVLLGVTGSVAAILTPDLYQALKKAGHQVKVVASKAALYFFDPAGIVPAKGKRNPEVVVLDEDEWPGQRYQRTDKVLHIELRRWADIFVIAPLDANTLAKLANGLCDNCLTCVWRAWDRSRQVILAPAMNTLMWEHPLTVRHFRQLALDAGAGPIPDLELPELLDWINDRGANLLVIPPQSKRLACDDIGVGAMAGLDNVVAAIGIVGSG